MFLVLLTQGTNCVFSVRGSSSSQRGHGVPLEAQVLILSVEAM